MTCRPSYRTFWVTFAIAFPLVFLATFALASS